MSNNKMNLKLYEIGKILNMNKSDVEKSKRSIKNIIYVCVAAGFISLISIFFVTKSGTVGLWYISPGIKDFNFFRGLF